MSKYVDIYLLPVPRKNISKYRKLARSVGRIYRKHGVLTYREYLESDLKIDGVVTPFPSLMKIRKGEVLIHVIVEFKSESHRNKIMKLIFNDPALRKMVSDKPIFDVKRLVYGGFKLLLEI